MILPHTGVGFGGNSASGTSRPLDESDPGTPHVFMKKLLALPLFLAACATADPIPNGPITDEATFRDLVVGKRIQVGTDAFMTINADNTISGEADGTTATGSWSFEDGFWCRTIRVGDIINEDCQLWVIDGNQLVITRERGQGESFVWTQVDG